MSNTTKFRTAYIRVLSKREVVSTKEVLKNKVYADFDAAGNLMGFEFIEPVNIEINGDVK